MLSSWLDSESFQQLESAAIASDGAVAVVVDADDPAADPAAAAAGCGAAPSSSLLLTHTPRAVSLRGGGGGSGLIAQPSSSVVVTYRMCTLNVGGRNTNSFEFMMRGDRGPLAQRWEVLYGRAERTMREKGPADVPSLAANLDAIAASVGVDEGSGPGSGDRGSGVAERLLAYPTWAAMMGALQSERSMLLNALNLTTLRQGRPSPLEMPENIVLAHARGDADHFSAGWISWLESTAGEKGGKRDAWPAKAKKHGLGVVDCCVGMHLFDVMCFVAMQAMYMGGTGSADDSAVAATDVVSISSDGGITPADALRQHIAFQAELPFTTENGKFSKLASILEQHAYPEVVCLQEAQELAEMHARTGDGNRKLDSALYRRSVEMA